jgi:hypothetical protein
MGPMNHAVAKVMQQMLVALGLGVDPDATPPTEGDWPVYWSNEPDQPDNAMTVYDTTFMDWGRQMATGLRVQHEGFQVRIRSMTPEQGNRQGRTVATALDTQVNQMRLSVESNIYIIAAVTRKSDVVQLGKERPKSNRSLFTINAIVAMHMAS